MKKLAICNQKGGVAKTTTAITLGAALTKKGYKVLLIDCDDSNPTLTKTLVTKSPDELPCTLVDLLLFTAMNRPIKDDLEKAIIHHEEGFDILPASNQLSGLTVYLNTLNEDMKNTCLSKALANLDAIYDFVILDAAPALNTLTMNVMAASDEIIIVSQAQDAAEEGIVELLRTTSRCKTNINNRLIITGLLITMEDRRTNYSKNTATKITEKYSALGMRVFQSRIPRGVAGEKFIASGNSLLKYEPRSKVTLAYLDFVDEYLAGMEG